MPISTQDHSTQVAYQASGLLSLVNRFPTTLLVFLLIALNFLTFIPHTNEEQYLLYARQNFDPNWITGSLMASEFPGTRLFYEYLTGWALHLFGFESTVFFGRAINYFLLALPLAAFFKYLRFTNVQLLICFQIFLLSKQSFFGNEWIFGAFEAKTLAYIFIFTALTRFVKGEYRSAFLWMIPATYFHILIGGWFAICCFLWLLFKRHAFSSIVQLGLLYGLPLLPLLYYLGKSMFAQLPAELDTVNLNHVYVYVRNKHHIGLFYTFEYFLQRHLFGVSMAVISLFVLLRWKPLVAFLKDRPALHCLRSLHFIMLGIGFFYLGISLIDKVFFDLSGGFMLKAYPFRMQGLALLFFVTIMMAFLFEHYGPRKWKPAFWTFLVAMLCLSALVQSGENIQKMAQYQSHEAYEEVIRFLKEQTPKSSVVLVLDNNKVSGYNQGHRNELAIDLIRRTERDNFFHFKYIPSTPTRMYAWYERLQLTRQLEDCPACIKELKGDHKIDYMLTTRPVESFSKPVFQNVDFLVYKL